MSARASAAGSGGRVGALDSLGGRVGITELLAGPDAFGLLSEDIDPETGALWGNIPQNYPMAGCIINSAMRLSVRWEGVWCRVSS